MSERFVYAVWVRAITTLTPYQARLRLYECLGRDTPDSVILKVSRNKGPSFLARHHERINYPIVDFEEVDEGSPYTTTIVLYVEAPVACDDVDRRLTERIKGYDRALGEGLNLDSVAFGYPVRQDLPSFGPVFGREGSPVVDEDDTGERITIRVTLDDLIGRGDKGSLPEDTARPLPKEPSKGRTPTPKRKIVSNLILMTKSTLTTQQFVERIDQLAAIGRRSIADRIGRFGAFCEQDNKSLLIGTDKGQPLDRGESITRCELVGEALKPEGYMQAVRVQVATQFSKTETVELLMRLLYAGKYEVQDRFDPVLADRLIGIDLESLSFFGNQADAEVGMSVN